MSNRSSDKSPSNIALWLGPVLLGITILVSMCLVIILMPAFSTVNGLLTNTEVVLESEHLEQNLASLLMEMSLQIKSVVFILTIVLTLSIVLLVVLAIAIIDRIWILMKFRAIREDYRILRERYNVLLGSKRIVDAEFKALQDKLSD